MGGMSMAASHPIDNERFHAQLLLEEDRCTPRKVTHEIIIQKAREVIPRQIEPRDQLRQDLLWPSERDEQAAPELLERLAQRSDALDQKARAHRRHPVARKVARVEHVDRDHLLGTLVVRGRCREDRVVVNTQIVTEPKDEALRVRGRALECRGARRSGRAGRRWWGGLGQLELLDRTPLPLVVQLVVELHQLFLVGDARGRHASRLRVRKEPFGWELRQQLGEQLRQQLG